MVLVDSDSTHNFIDQVVAKKLRCTTQPMIGINVTVANGDVLKVHEVCKSLKWKS